MNFKKIADTSFKRFLSKAKQQEPLSGNSSFTDNSLFFA